MPLVLPWRLQCKFALLLLLSCAALLADAAEAVLVQASRQGDAVQVRAQATVKPINPRVTVSMRSSMMSC